MYFPFRIAKLAVESDEQHLFTRVNGFMTAAYQLVAQGGESQVRDLVLDRCSQYPQSFAEYGLIRRLESDITPLNELPKLGWYLLYSIRLYNELLKAAVDAEDIDSFNQFGTALDRALQHYHPDQAIPNHYSLEFQLENESLDSEEREELQRELTRYSTLVQIREKAEEIRNGIWFGVSGWLVREFSGGRIQQPLFARMFEQARGHFNDLRELSSIFLGVQREEQRGLGWSNWVLFQLPEGEVHWIDTESWMRQFYCIQGLRLTPEEITDEGTPIVPDRAFEHMLESMEPTCRQLREERHLWQGTVTDVDLGHIDNFLELHRRAVVAEKHQQERRLIEHPISQIKWQSFQQRFLENWRENASVRALVARFGIVEDLTDQPPPEDMLAYGVNILDDKAAYVEDWHVLYPDWGSGYGRDMAVSENTLVTSQMAEGCADKESIEPKDALDRIVAAIEFLRRQGYTPNVIIIGSSRWFRSFLLRAEGFTPHWAPECELLDVPGFEGRVQGVPVVRIWRYPSDTALIIDLRAFGRWAQYQVAAAPGQIFDFHLSEIDREEAERLLAEQPELLEDWGIETRDEGIWRLQQKVHLRILERFEYLVSDPYAGIRLVVQQGEDD